MTWTIFSMRPMLGKRLNVFQDLLSLRSLPIHQKLLLVKIAPLHNQTKRPTRQRTAEQLKGVN